MIQLIESEPVAIRGVVEGTSIVTEVRQIVVHPASAVDDDPGEGHATSHP